MMNIIDIDRVRKLRRTVAGRLVQTTTDMDRVLAQRQHPAINPLVDAARGRARAYIEVRTQRDAQLELRGEGKAGEIDAEADILLATLHDTARRYVRRLPKHPKGKAAGRILQACFRRGLAAVTNVPYENELVLVEYINERLTGDLADDIRLLGLSATVAELGEVVPRYRDALAMQDKISAAEVAAAYEAMQVAYFRLAFAVVAMVESDADRAALLAPIFDQDDRLGAIYAARRAGQSGVADDVVDPDAEAEALLDAELAEAEAARAAEAAEGAEQVRVEGIDGVDLGGGPLAGDGAAGDAPGVDDGRAEGPVVGPIGRG